MKLSSYQFVLQQFEAERYRYFAIYDEDGVLQLSQMDAPDPAAALVRLRSFLKNNDGYFEVYVFNRKIHASTLIERDRKYIAKYAVELNSSGGVSGFSSVSGVSTPVSASPIPGFSHTVLPADDPRNGAPNSWDMMTRMGAMETQMKLMEKDHAHQREMSERDREIDRLNAELERARGMGAVGDQLKGLIGPQLVMGALGAILGPKSAQSAPHHPAPMNGVMVQDEIPTAEDTIMESGAQNNDNMKQFNQGAQGANTGSVDRAVNANLSERQRRMIQAVNDLARNDPNFPENIEKLASIARTNPAVYQMAVQYLKTL
jgi:hypothetical protein